MPRSRRIRQSTSIRLWLLGNAEDWSLVTPWQGRSIKLDAAGSPAVTHSPLELCKLMVTDTVLSPSYGQAISTPRPPAKLSQSGLTAHFYSFTRWKFCARPVLDTLRVKH